MLSFLSSFRRPHTPNDWVRRGGAKRTRTASGGFESDERIEDGDSELSMFNKGDDGPGIDDIANKLLDRDQVSKKNEGNLYHTD